MTLKAGIIGLPNVGKSTLFNAIVNSQVETANYPFTTIEPNVGIIELKDPRVFKLAEIVKPKKVVFSTLKIVDIAGLVKGASKGQGLGNKFLSHIREVDAIIEVVRCFNNNDIIHIEGQVNPNADINIIDMELLLADLETISNVINKIKKRLKTNIPKVLIFEYQTSLKVQEHLKKEHPVRTMALSQKEKDVIKTWNLLTIKPIIYIANIDDHFVKNPNMSISYQKLIKSFTKLGSKYFALSANLELAITQSKDIAEKEMLLQEFQIQEIGIYKLVHMIFDVLNLATYFTAGKKEVRSWTFKKGMLAPQCAGIIHSDFARGFIKADVISYQDYTTFGNDFLVKKAGKNRLEGKNYVVQDGDVIEFKFNV